MKTNSRLLALERIYNKALKDCNKEQKRELGIDYATIMQAVMALHKHEAQSPKKKAILLGGEG